MYQNFTIAVICTQVLLSDPMKTDLEKVLKNKPHPQKAPKSHPVGGINRDDGGYTAGPWKDGMLRLIQQLFSHKKERYPISSQMSPDTNEPFLRGGSNQLHVTELAQLL